MKLPLPRLIGALVCCAALTSTVQAEPGHENFGASRPTNDMNLVRVETVQGEHLGRIKDLGIDLSNGRIIEVFVTSGGFLGLGGKIVAVPPGALRLDPARPVAYLDTTVETFKAAPALRLSDLPDDHRTDLVAAAYQRFGQEPYFLVRGETSSLLASRPKVDLSTVHSASGLLRMPVRNLQNEPLGTVSSIKYDIQAATVLTVVVKSPGYIDTQSVVPATALSFTEDRKALLLDQTKAQFAEQPRAIVTPAAHGQAASSVEEPYSGERTDIALEQGASYRDIDRTALISRELRKAKIRGLLVKVGTLDGRVTLRGFARSEADRLRAGAIAVEASRLEVVDNQIVVSPRN